MPSALQLPSLTSAFHIRLRPGTQDGAIWRWERESGASAVLREHTSAVSAIKCNPTRQMLASADSSVCLWLPP